MKKSIATKWVKALRSGKYKKTTHILKDNNGYCCLGVLCEVVGKSFKKTGPNIYVVEGCTTILPETVCSISGMKTKTGHFPTGTVYNKAESLVAINDHKAKSFRMVANAIEKHWKDL